MCVWCEFWTGSLPSQLCPCARAISPSLTFTAQLPTDRPPLHHFVSMSVPLSLFSGPRKKKRGGEMSFFLFFSPFKSSGKFHLRLSFSLLVKLFVVYTRLSVHALSALLSAIFAAVIKAINSCECIPFSWVSFCLGPTTNNNATRSAHYFLMAYLSRAPQSNQTADNESKEAI